MRHSEALMHHLVHHIPLTNLRQTFLLSTTLMVLQLQEKHISELKKFRDETWYSNNIPSLKCHYGRSDIGKLTLIIKHKGCFQLAIDSKHHQQFHINKNFTYSIVHYHLKPDNYDICLEDEHKNNTASLPHPIYPLGILQFSKTRGFFPYIPIGICICELKKKTRRRDDQTIIF